MTPSELKANILAHDPDSHFFDRKTMKFFGDAITNYGVRKTVILSFYDEFDRHNEKPVFLEVWELYRKRPVKHGLQSSAFFRVSDFKQVLRRR